MHFGPTPAIFQRTLWVALCVMLLGCGQVTFEDQLNDYGQRLARVLQAPIAVPDLSRPSLALPERRVLAANIAAIKVNVWQFLQLYDCALNRLIGEHNSILGRHQGAGWQLFYDVEFIRLADSCLAQAAAPNEGVHAELDTARRQKHNTLGLRLHNALLASEEWQAFFSVYAPGLAHQSTTERTSMIGEAIGDLNTISTALLHAANAPELASLMARRADFERALGVLQTHKFAGQVLVAMTRATASLNAYNGAITSSLAAGDVCRTAAKQAVLIDPHTAKALRHVFYEVYLAQVQPSLAAIDKAAQQVQRLAPLVELSPASAPREFRQYWQRHWQATGNTTFTQFRYAVKSHASAWQQLLARCDILQLPAVELPPAP